MAPLWFDNWRRDLVLSLRTPAVYKGKPQGFTRWMKHRVRSGMDIKNALAEQLDWVKFNGETLEGYYARYAGHDKERVRKIWEQDMAYLTYLASLGLLERAGVQPDADDVLN